MKKIISILVLGLLWSGAANAKQFSKCIQGDCINGKGTYIFSNIRAKLFNEEVKYEGEFKDKKPHGQGIMTFPDGGKYVGEFKDGNQDGKGTETYPDGNRYIGEFRNGKPHGLGKRLFSDGSEFIGEFKDGKRNGKGTYIIDGKKYTDTYKDDEKVK